MRIGAPRSFDDDTLRYSLSGFALASRCCPALPLLRVLPPTPGPIPPAGRSADRTHPVLPSCGRLPDRQQPCQPPAGPRVAPARRGRRHGRSAPAAPPAGTLRQPLFDILLLDSLYPQAPVLKLAREIDWDVVITLKQEKRDLYQNATGCSRRAGPITTSANRRPARRPKSNSGTRRASRSPRTIRSPCASCGRGKGHGAASPAGPSGARNHRSRVDLDHHPGRPGISRPGGPQSGTRPLETGKQRLERPHSLQPPIRTPS